MSIFVQNAIERLGFESIISNDPAKLKNCSHYILPGVGAFDEAKKQLDESGILPFLETVIFEEKKPVLGICVGMQLMLDTSTENGLHSGLGWVKGKVKPIEASETYKIPHVGWNNVTFQDSPLFQNLEQDTDFYFDHSYACQVNESVVIGTTQYSDEIHAAIRKDNLYAVQFHPEKSQLAGLRVFKNFLTLC